MLRYGLGWKAADAVLITHLHLDHVIGLLGYLATLKRMGHDQPIPVRVPSGSAETLRLMLSSWGLRDAARISDSSEGPEEFHGGTVSTFEIAHADTPCCGYLFTLDGRWHLDTEALKAHGVPTGPCRRELAEGRPVVLSDGRAVLPEEVRGRYQPPMRVVFSGDSSSWEEVANRAGGADLLVGEATFLERDTELARRTGHLTAGELAYAARVAGVRWLIATHISQRHTAEEYLAELRAVFPASLVAEDGLRIALTQTGELVK
jgi:ribonuclease Z